MQASQILPGSPSPSTPLIQFRLSNFDLLAYVSGNSIVIMTSQLNVLQIFDVSYAYAQAKYKQEKDLYYKQNKSAYRIPDTFQSSKSSSIVNLTWQNSRTGRLAVCISDCVVIFQPVSGRMILEKAQGGASSLLPYLYQLENREKKDRNDQNFPINIATSILSSPPLKVPHLKPEEIVDLNDVVYQEHLTIVHDFSPSCSSFFSYGADEFLLVGGDMLVLWKIFNDESNDGVKESIAESILEHEFFTPPDSLALSDFDPKLYKFFNDQIDYFRSSKNRENISENMRKVFPIPNYFPSASDSSFYIFQENYNPLGVIPYCKYPYGHVPEWFDNGRSNGNRKFRMLWIKTKIPSISHVSFSPDIRLFATVGYHDRNVKVWYYGPHGLSFIYLSHSRMVADIQWHRYATYRDFNRNVLLVRLIDGTCTLWEESEPWTRLRFNLKLTLNEPVSCVQWLLPPVFHLTEFLDQHKLEKSSNSDIINTSWIRNTEAFEPQLEYQSTEQLSSLNVFDCLHRVCIYSSMNRYLFIPLKSSPMEIQDWIVGLKKDGSILIWKVKGLGIPKCVLMITLWSHLKHVLSTRNENFYSQLVVLSLRFSFASHLYHPSLINVYTYSAIKSDLLCWMVDTSVINRGQAVLYKRIKGHSSSITDIQAHPMLPLVCSSDMSKTLIWKLNDTTIRSSDFVLQSVCYLPQNSLSRWDQDDAIIYCYFSPEYTTHPGVYAYLVDIAEEDGFTLSDWFTPQLLSILENSMDLRNGRNEPVKLSYLEMLPPVYFTLREECVKLPRNESLVLGVSEDGTCMFIWKVNKFLPLYTQCTMEPSRTPLWTAFHHNSPEGTLLATSAPALGRKVNSSSPVSYEDWVQSKMIVRYRLDPSMAINTLARPYSIHINDQRRHRCIASILTGGVDGIVRAWRLINSQVNGDDIWSWVPILHFCAHDGEVDLIRCSSFGRIATCSRTEIKIWECESSFPIFFLEATIPITGRQGDLNTVCSNTGDSIFPTQSGSSFSVQSGSCSNDSIDALLMNSAVSQMSNKTKELLRLLKRIKSRNEESLYLCLNVSMALSISHFIFLPNSVQNKLLNVLERFQSRYLLDEGEMQQKVEGHSVDADGEASIGKKSADDDVSTGNNLEEHRSAILEGMRFFNDHQFLGNNSFKEMKMSNIDYCLTSNEIKNSNLSFSQVDFDWITGPIGISLLVVTVDGYISIWAMRFNERLLEFKSQWKIVDQVKISGSRVAWTSFGQLIVGDTNILRVFTKTYPDNTNFITLAEKWQSALPFYHPKLILELVMSGCFDMVRSICKVIYDAVSSGLDSHRSVEDKDDIGSENGIMDDMVVTFVDSLDFELNRDVLKLELKNFLKRCKEENHFPEDLKVANGGEGEGNVSGNGIGATSAGTGDFSSKTDYVDHYVEGAIASDVYNVKSDKDSSWLLDDDEGEDIWSFDMKTDRKGDGGGGVLRDVMVSTEASRLMAACDARFLCDALKHVELKGLKKHYRNMLIELIEVLAGVEQTWDIGGASLRYIIIARFFLKIGRFEEMGRYFLELPSYVWCWALLSEDANLIAKDFLSRMCEGEFWLTWGNIRSLGVPLWCSDVDILKEYCWNLAKSIYRKSQNPSDVVIWYMALNKVSALATLYKLKNDEKLHTFFSNNFKEPRWKQAAMNNAYALLRKQKFEMSVGLFLLAGRWTEALDVCLTRIKDWMLAIFIAKIVESNPEGLQSKRVYDCIYEVAVKNGDHGIQFIVRWMSGGYGSALGHLLPYNLLNSTVVLTGPNNQREDRSGKSETREAVKCDDIGRTGEDKSETREAVKCDTIGRTGEDKMKFYKFSSGDCDCFCASGEDAMESKFYMWPLLCEEDLYQYHLDCELKWELNSVGGAYSNFNPGIYELFKFLLGHPHLKEFASGPIDKGTSFWMLDRLKDNVPFEFSEVMRMGRLEVNHLLKSKLTFVYLYSGLSRLVMQMDLDELGERAKWVQSLKAEILYEDTGWLFDSSFRGARGLGKRLMTREIEFKCALQFLSNEIDLEKLSSFPDLEYESIFTLRKFFLIILHYHSGLIAESVVKALGQFCENRQCFYQHYALLRAMLNIEVNDSYTFIKVMSRDDPKLKGLMAEVEKEMGLVDASGGDGVGSVADEEIRTGLGNRNALNSDTHTKTGTSGDALNSTENVKDVYTARESMQNVTLEKLYLKRTDVEILYNSLNPSSVAASGQYLIFTAQKVMSVCHDLVSNTFSLHQNNIVDKLSDELKFCLLLHVSNPDTTISMKACAGILASIELGYFVSQLINRDYETVYNLLCDIGMDFEFLREFMTSRTRKDGVEVKVGDVILQFKEFEMKRRDRSQRNGVTSSLQLTNLFPLPGSEKYNELHEQSRLGSLKKSTETFLERLLHVALVVKFIYQLEEFLFAYFPKPKSLSLIKVLEQWKLCLENTLKDITFQIIESRLDEIRFGRSLYIFDNVFFSSFIRQSSLYKENAIISELWKLACSDTNVVQYFRHADYLKQTVRFVRLHYFLEMDFSEQDRYNEPKVFQMLMHDSAITSNFASVIRSRPERKSISSKYKGVEGLSKVNDEFFNEIPARFLCPLELIPIVVCRKFFVENYLSCANHRKLEFKMASQPILIYKDNKSLQAFVMNPTNSKQIAIATGHGLIEITKPLRDVVEPEITDDASSNSEKLPTATRIEFLDLGLCEREEISPLLDGHPVYPYYLSASLEGSLKLWQFNVGQVLNIYTTNTGSRSARVRFNSNGNRIGSLSTNGVLELWRFEASEESLDSYLSLPCLKRGFDFQFLSTGSVLAVCGDGPSGRNLCLVDTLIAPRKSIVATMYSDQPISSLVYSPRLQMLITANQRGTISAVDMRNLMVVKTFDASLRTKCHVKQLCLDPTHRVLVSSGEDKDMIFWDLLTFKKLYTWKDVHIKGFQSRNGLVSHGITQVTIEGNTIMSSGADGRLIQSTYSTCFY